MSEQPDGVVVVARLEHHHPSFALVHAGRSRCTGAVPVAGA
jgi:hypothetical protein